jgi:hypothetical protein
LAERYKWTIDEILSLTNLQLVRLMKGYNKNLKAQNKDSGDRSSGHGKKGGMKDIKGLIGAKGVSTNLGDNKKFAKKYNTLRKKMYELRDKHKEKKNGS